MSGWQCQFWATKKWYPRGKSLVKTIDFPGGVVCLRLASGLLRFGDDAAIRSDPTFTRTSPRLRSYAERKLPQMNHFPLLAPLASARLAAYLTILVVSGCIAYESI